MKLGGSQQDAESLGVPRASPGLRWGIGHGNLGLHGRMAQEWREGPQLSFSEVLREVEGVLTVLPETEVSVGTKFAHRVNHTGIKCYIFGFIQ